MHTVKRIFFSPITFIIAVSLTVITLVALWGLVCPEKFILFPLLIAAVIGGVIFLAWLRVKENMLLAIVLIRLCDAME